MANPSGRENPSELTLLDADGNAAGSYWGRPPDLVVIVDEPAGLERSGSLIASEVQPCNKKGRNLVENVSDVAMGDRVATQTSVVGSDHLVVANNGKGAGGYGELSRQPTPSFRDKLLGSVGGVVGKKSIAELDVDVRHEDDVCGISLTVETSVATDSNLRSSDDLFGPWMQAPSRRRRNVPAKKDVGSTVASSASRSGGSGSRYSIFADIQGSDAADEEIVPAHHDNRDISVSANIVVPLVVPARVPTINHGGRTCGRVVLREREDSPLGEEQPKGVTDERVESGQLEQVAPVLLASQGRVVAAKTSFPAATNVAVHVMDSVLPFPSHVMKGRVLPNSIRGTASKMIMKKPGAPPGPKTMAPKQRKKEGRTALHSTLEAGLSNLMEDLAQSELLEVSRLGSSPPQGVGDGDQFVWEHNSAFEQMPSSDMQF
ncbi:hypothetical protein V6N11_022343 [Hibiscus sabdariffa]|uniref:Uncharacterized protein n=1 Tax=Hibiscus sabdariffa TaxID=183260 RepID=A0ABR2TJM9_9ROSI